MKNNIASIAASPAADDLKVSARIAESERLLDKAEKFEAFVAEIEGGTPSFWRLARISPISLISLLWRFLVSRHENRMSEAEADAKYSDILRTAKDSSNLVRSGLVNQHIDGAFRVRIEQESHFPRYFESEPYLRLALNRVFFGEDHMEEDAIEISLMIHRSGICSLTLSSGLAEQLNVNQARAAMYSSMRHLNFAKISFAVMDKYLRKNGVKPSKKSIEGLGLEQFENQRWIRLPGEGETESQRGPLTIRSIFQYYLGAVEELANRSAAVDWTCYTTLSLGAPACCAGNEAKAVHRKDFGALMLRLRRDVEIQESSIESLLENHLKIASKELWVSVGNAIYIDWTGREPDYEDDMYVLIPIESALSQNKQLEQIDSITSNSVIKDRQLFKTQKMLAVGLQEYRRNFLTGVDGPAIVDAILNKLDSHVLYSRLLDRVKSSESLVSARYSRMQNRRSVAISAAGFLVVLFALLPRISDTLEEFNQKGGWGAALTARIDDIFGGRNDAVLNIYVLVVSISLLVIVSLSFRIRLKFWHRTSFGKRTRRLISVTLAEKQ
ncbi:hypothetical protein AB0M22_00800 [Nocardia sp. NPDC051756]|uniref:hypothetical protein n=1 Tax=Nocardia sp. NPDC051756 TaxID=3154751 RepID=UPI00341A731F